MSREQAKEQWTIDGSVRGRSGASQPPFTNKFLLGLDQKSLGPRVAAAGDDIDERHAGLHVRDRRFDGGVIHEFVLNLGWTCRTESDTVKTFFGAEVFTFDGHFLARFGFVRFDLVYFGAFRPVTDGITFDPLCIRTLD